MVNVGLVRLQGRLATQAQVRFLGNATLRMMYVYSEIDGHKFAGR